MDHHQQNRKQMASPEVALANEVFDQFCNATTLKSILGHFRHLCDLLKIKPTNFNQFYPKLKSKLRSWKAQALWKKFDQRANHKCYNRGKACPNTRVLIIGGGPCGMRSAIEAQLLGAKVVVVEKRDRMSRNNVLHLWPFVIQDLRALGAKKFFGKFCAGSIDHISIRQLQCILLKVALILGVEFHENVSFEALVPPPDHQNDGKIGWRAKTDPAEHPVSQYEFDVLIGADGKRNTLEGFKRKEFRGKLAIAITANFINKKTEAEARVEEISGVAFIFNQKFFKELYSETGIDLENIVYYKDETHYFVMTAKKHSLIDKGVILQDHADTAKLLAKENVDREALMMYAREAAEFSTEYQMMDMEFAVNHYGQPDVAMFDFTSMYAAENASRVLERRGHRLLQILVGDSLLEPFWPTGSGCARGFLSSLDACWAIKGWGGSHTPLEVIAERESIYRLLGQTTPENLNRDYAAYTLDPHTRYPNLNVRSVTTVQVRSQLDTDDPETFKLLPVQTAIDLPKKRRRKDSQVHPDTLLHWLQRQVALYEGVRIHDMGESFKSGLAIAAIIHYYRPDLIDYHALKKDDHVANNQLAFDILEKELGITPIMTGEEMVQCDVPDKLTMFSYLTQIYEAFRGEIPHIKHPKLEPETEDRPTFSQKLNVLTPEQKAQILGRIASKEGSVAAARVRRSRHVNENSPLPGDKKSDSMARRHARKRRSNEKMGASVEERMQRLQDIEKNRLERMLRRQYQRKMATQQFYKSMQMLQANAKREKDEPFEDYSIFLYRQTAADFKDRVKDLEQKILYPDREPKMHAGHHRGSIDEGFSGRIKNIEEKLKGTASTDKKPKDLLRAIGKIEKTDWNVKEIEKKIEENKMGRGVRHDKVERVPKWSREQFLARQTKMEKMKGREPMETDSKYAEIDNTLKSIDRKIKEGNVLGHNKVSAMAEQFANKNQDAQAAAAGQPEQPKVQRSNSKATIALPAQGGSEMCHFCDKRVYLMERLTAEGKSFHRGCFRCEYCSTSLRIGNHTFDRDKNGGRFYCTQHFGLPGTMKTRSDRKKLPLTNKENIPQSSNALKTPDKAKSALEGISGLDLLDRGQTPERIEFENLAGMSDAEEAQSIMDEDEWTDRNFGPSAAEMGSSDDISDMSDSDDDNEVFEEAIDQPLTTEGTLELAKNWTLRYSHPHPAAGNSDTGSNEYEDSSDEYTTSEEDSQTATEDEDEARAREARKKEVWLKVPPLISDTETGSETEVKHQAQLTQASNSVVEQQQPESGNLLPDAIPLRTNHFLPDLVASSPKLSGSSDPSFEDASPLTLKIENPDTTWLEVEAVLNRSKSNGHGPMLVVTAPTPTTERPPDNPFIEESKLIVPKEQSPAPQEEANETPTSFDNLLLELRQRKAKNKAEAEAKEALKPLATETAKMQMNKYFDAKKKTDKLEENGDVKVVELQMKSKLSDKVEKKDMLKYFSGASFAAKTPSPPLPERSPSPVAVEAQNDSDLEFLNELNEEELDLDEIEEEFRRIERQNKISLELLKSTGDKRRLSDSQVSVDPMEITQIAKKSRDDSEIPRVSVADMVSKINASKSASNMYINWNGNDENRQARKMSLDGAVGKLSPALQRKFSYDSASKPVLRVVKKHGSPAVLRRLSDAGRQFEGEDVKNGGFAVPRRFSDDSVRKLVASEDAKNESCAASRRFSDDNAQKQVVDEDTKKENCAASKSSDGNSQRPIMPQDTKQRSSVMTHELLHDHDNGNVNVFNGSLVIPGKPSGTGSSTEKTVKREVAKNANSTLPYRKMSYDAASSSTKQSVAQDNLYRKGSYDTAIDKANEVDVYTVTQRSPLLDRLDSIKHMIQCTSSDLENKVNGSKTIHAKSSSITDKETLKSPLLVSKLNHSNPATHVKSDEQVEFRKSRSPVKKFNEQRKELSKSPSPSSRVSQLCKDIESKPKEQVLMPKSPSPVRSQRSDTKASHPTPAPRSHKTVSPKSNEQSKVPVAINKMNDLQEAVNQKPKESVPLPKSSSPTSGPNDLRKIVNRKPEQYASSPKSPLAVESNNQQKTDDTKPEEQTPAVEPSSTATSVTTKLKEQVSMPKSSSLVKEQQRTIDSKQPKERLPIEQAHAQSPSLAKILNEPQRVVISSSDTTQSQLTPKASRSPLLDRIESMKQNIQKIVVHEQDLLPIRVTEVKTPERLFARIETYPADSLSTSSSDSLKRPGRRRPSEENLSISSSPVRKSLSTRLKSPESPLSFRKRNGTLSGSFKSVDSTRSAGSAARKDKCVIS